MAEGGNVGGYYTGMFIIGFIMLFFALANLAVGIANAVVCGMLGSVGYGIWGSVLVSVQQYVIQSQLISSRWVLTVGQWNRATVEDFRVNFEYWANVVSEDRCDVVIAVTLRKRAEG